MLRHPALVASFSGTNLADVETRDLDAYPLPGRALFATLTVRFGDAPPTRFPSPRSLPRSLP